MAIRIRVHAKTEDGEWRIITYAPASTKLRCSCWSDLDQFCAHVDAVLNAGERHMVHPADRETADLLAQEIAPIPVPADWKGSWRRNKRWRGLPVTDRRPSQPSERHQALGLTAQDYATRPAVVFTGQFAISRNELVAEAEAHGWQCAATARDDVRYVVAGPEQSSSNKIKAAGRKGIPVIDIDEWRQIMSRIID